ncbi:MAG: four helix bundle protein [Acidobacteria bacterium]|nr:four helix bundle protein [Acidobacteriota bacterium]HEV8160167.1 four helix bundle protein [Pyrinomonadaceae bacterium]
MAGRSYKDLLVWQKAMNLVTNVYNLIKTFPKEEIYGLSGQLRRAIVSVPSNIAEGQGRDSVKEFIHYLSISYGSLMEVETQLQIAANLGYLKQVEVDKLLEQTAEVGRLLNGLSRSLRK